MTKNLTHKPMEDALRARQPVCLRCSEPISLRHSTLPHGWLHEQCEKKSVVTPEVLLAR